MYIHNQKEWPNFTWKLDKLINLLIQVRSAQTKLQGQMKFLNSSFCEEATLKILTEDVLKTSEIEGEQLDAEQVRSSLAKRLKIDIGKTVRSNRNVDGIVEIMLDVTRNFEAPLTKERLFNWHTRLFPTGQTDMHTITVGNWRPASSGAMKIVSGPIGREKVHFEAPSASRLKTEMTHFIKWFNSSSDIEPIIKSAIAHFWFVTIHPFEDGNGRIGRAIADMMLIRSEGNSQRFYSMSAQIQKECKAYYLILEKCSKGSLDITPWIEWFLGCLKRAIDSSQTTLESVLAKASFWNAHLNESFNPRQRLLINRLFNGFEGKLTSSKWAKIAKCSQDTALRDINDLLNRNILKKESSGGRSTNYLLGETTRFSL